MRIVSIHHLYLSGHQLWPSAMCDGVACLPDCHVFYFLVKVQQALQIQ